METAVILGGGETIIVPVIALDQLSLLPIFEDEPRVAVPLNIRIGAHHFNLICQVKLVNGGNRYAIDLLEKKVKKLSFKAEMRGEAGEEQKLSLKTDRFGNDPRLKGVDLHFTKLLLLLIEELTARDELFLVHVVRPDRRLQTAKWEAGFGKLFLSFGYIKKGKSFIKQYQGSAHRG
ncbi:MAG: hypothetical protein AAB833_01540 [Patescibacteria group bacterium]